MGVGDISLLSHLTDFVGHSIGALSCCFLLLCLQEGSRASTGLCVDVGPKMRSNDTNETMQAITIQLEFVTQLLQHL